MTKTQTFSKEERGVVHLLYDPDFRDKNDFRQDLRKVSKALVLVLTRIHLLPTNMLLLKMATSAFQR